MAQTKSNDNAFPLCASEDYIQCGLTKREFFTAIAFHAYLHVEGISDAIRARVAVQSADELIKALNQPKSDEPINS